MSAQSSPIGVKADNKYSSRVFQLLTQTGHCEAHTSFRSDYRRAKPPSAFTIAANKV